MKTKSLLIVIVAVMIAINSLAQSTNTFTDSRDGKTYKTVKIGTQTWMAENLAFRTSSGCWAYNNNQSNVINYGYLYNWSTANEGCPSGWHLPSATEWNKLNSFLGEGVSGGKLKESGITHWNNPNVGATNESGFTALPGGSRTSNSGETYFEDLRRVGYWWSSTKDNNGAPTGRQLWCGDVSLNGNGGMPPEQTGFSVRCIKNGETEPEIKVEENTGSWGKRSVTKFQMQNPQTKSYEDIMFTNPGKYIEIRNEKDIRIQDLDMLEMMVQSPVAGRYKEGQFTDGVRESTTAELTIRYRGNFVLFDNNGLPSKQDLTIIDFFYDRNNRLSGLTYSSNICKCRAQIFFTDYKEGLQILK